MTALCLWATDPGHVLTLRCGRACGVRGACRAQLDVATRSLEDDVADLAFFRALVGAHSSGQWCCRDMCCESASRSRPGLFSHATAAVLARGDAVAVASFGRYEVILAFLQRICPGVFTRENISTPSCVGVPDGCSVPAGKTPQLDGLMRALLPNSRDRVLFFDDSAHNVKVRQRRCPAKRMAQPIYSSSQHLTCRASRSSLSPLAMHGHTTCQRAASRARRGAPSSLRPEKTRCSHSAPRLLT